MQPTGRLHISNYLGAIRHWVTLQAEFARLFCIVDLHALTTPHGPSTLQTTIHNVTALRLAAGIDPAHSLVFVQSRVPAHAELAWLLNCVIPMGWLQWMIQFKDKARTRKQEVSIGLFAYPVLMADILLYDTDYVPVGEDQTQHLEITRDVVQRFNTLYGETFTLPKPLVPAAWSAY